MGGLTWVEYEGNSPLVCLNLLVVHAVGLRKRPNLISHVPRNVIFCTFQQKIWQETPCRSDFCNSPCATLHRKKKTLRTRDFARRGKWLRHHTHVHFLPLADPRLCLASKWVIRRKSKRTRNGGKLFRFLYGWCVYRISAFANFSYR